MKLYIAGPMTGYPEHNFPAFNRAANTLRELGHETVNPAELDGPDFDHANPEPWEHYLRRDIVLLLECDGIFLLPGWSESKGAKLELSIASNLKMGVFDRFDDIAKGISHGR